MFRVLQKPFLCRDNGQILPAKRKSNLHSTHHATGELESGGREAI